MFKVGDEVRLVMMADDPVPIPNGTVGTVTSVNPVDLGDGPFVQYGVDWENGRGLMVCVPPDRIELVRQAPNRVAS